MDIFFTIRITNSNYSSNPSRWHMNEKGWVRTRTTPRAHTQVEVSSCYSSPAKCGMMLGSLYPDLLFFREREKEKERETENILFFPKWNANFLFLNVHWKKIICKCYIEPLGCQFTFVLWEICITWGIYKLFFFRNLVFIFPKLKLKERKGHSYPKKSLFELYEVDNYLH